MVAIKAPGFGERKSSYLEDIAILTGAQVVKDEVGLQVDKVRMQSLYSMLCSSLHDSPVCLCFLGHCHPARRVSVQR